MVSSKSYSSPYLGLPKIIQSRVGLGMLLPHKTVLDLGQGSCRKPIQEILQRFSRLLFIVLTHFWSLALNGPLPKNYTNGVGLGMSLSHNTVLDLSHDELEETYTRNFRGMQQVTVHSSGPPSELSDE